MDTDPKKLMQQVEKIIDESQGTKECSVIVQMASADDEKKREVMVQTASEVIQRRRLTLNPRDLLPVPRNQLRESKTGNRTPAVRKQLLTADTSFAAQVAAIALPVLTKAIMRSVGLGALTPLLDSDVVKEAATTAVATFWTSKSAAITMKRDDLNKLPSVHNVRNVHLNRMLRIPPLVEVKNLPTTILENKASAWGVNAIGALAAWGAYETRGQGIKIGLLDTGVDAGHPDLRDKVTAWAEFDFDGKEVANSKPHDTDQHGTHCAGTLVGGNSSGQWIGVAPQAEIAAALVINGTAGGSDAQLLAGIQWAIEQGVDVISMSLGGLTLDPEPPPTFTEAIVTALMAGIPVVTAIGNEGSQTTGSPGNDIFAFAVGATDHRDQIAGFSGGRTQIVYQSDFLQPALLPLPYTKPDISAPGVAVRSSIPGDTWASFNGTSMATPHVAGAIALLLSATSIRKQVGLNERAFLIQDLLTGAAEELGESGKNQRFGFGRLDVLRTIGFAKELGY
ncbi:MAG TPA: S8 family serine peptidase [Candidatus Tectomicrobia bacterium]